MHVTLSLSLRQIKLRVHVTQQMLLDFQKLYSTARYKVPQGVEHRWWYISRYVCVCLYGRNWLTQVLILTYVTLKACLQQCGPVARTVLDTLTCWAAMNSSRMLAESGKTIAIVLMTMVMSVTCVAGRGFIGPSDELNHLNVSRFVFITVIADFVLIVDSK